MTDNGWVVTPKPAAPELAEDYEPQRYDGDDDYREGLKVSIRDKIGAAKMEELMLIFGGYPHDPSTVNQ